MVWLPILTQNCSCHYDLNGAAPLPHYDQAQNTVTVGLPVLERVSLGEKTSGKIERLSYNVAIL